MEENKEQNKGMKNGKKSGKKKLRITRQEALGMLFELAAECYGAGCGEGGRAAGNEMQGEMRQGGRRGLPVETVGIGECYGRVAARDIVAEENVPPFAKAPLDGYAIRGEETAAASEDNPVVMKITEEIAAGGVPHFPVGPGQAAKILTGAPVPEGVNTVVRYEETEFTESEVRFTAPATPDKDIVPAGDDIKKGRVIIKQGEVFTAPVAGMMAALGITEIPVFRRPKIAVISTGSEITDPADSPASEGNAGDIKTAEEEGGTAGGLAPGKIRNSSYHLLRGYLEGAGAEVGGSDVVPDDADMIAEHIERALKHSDMVITTGGVSVGDYDYMLAATDKIGARRLFWKVRFRPGGTMLAAEKDGKLILGLSGNPASASLALHIIGMPFIKRIAGRPAEEPERITAELMEPIKKDSPFGRLVRGRLVLKDGKCYFSSVDNQGNGALSSLLGCDLIADIPADTPPLPAGTVIEAYRI